MELKRIIGCIESGGTYLGIELGSTRIKAALINDGHRIIATGVHSWENRLEGGYWTYSEADILSGLQRAYASLAGDVKAKYGIALRKIGAIGISAMMHGYMPIGTDGGLLVPFRTWRNTTAEGAAARLTELFGFNIPARWSIAHLYQAVLDGEAHVRDICRITTLAGYIHFLLTGEHVVGAGEASGMFPVECGTTEYDRGMIEKFNSLIREKKYTWDTKKLLPKIRLAGENAGTLTEAGSLLLDPDGNLAPGARLCPPEGDAGTGMTATNSVAVRTGNVSAGTSIFSMIVMEELPKNVYPEIDIVMTPDGKPVSMVHCNNCTNEINAWAELFSESAALFGAEPETGDVFERLYKAALKAERDAGGVVVYNNLAGEPVLGLSEGRPMVVRTPEARFTLANLMRAQLYSCVAPLKIGMDILAKENVKLDRLVGHGGFFKTAEVGQRVLAAATGVSVSVLENAAEGGAWGMAILAAYMANKADGETLERYLAERVFDGVSYAEVQPNAEDVAGFAEYMLRYKSGLNAEKAAINSL